MVVNSDSQIVLVTFTWDLIDGLTQYNIDLDVYNFVGKSPYVYAIGSEGYTKLNYNTGDYTQTTELSKYSAVDQVIFRQLEATKDTVSYQRRHPVH